MPEVVEVCIMANYLNDYLKNKELKSIKILSNYKRIKGLNEFINKLPLTFDKVDSKGKFMWFELYDENNYKYYILNTFGLEGIWTFNKNDKYNKLSFNDDIYFSDSVSFGSLEFCEDPCFLYNKLNKLAPDVLKHSYTDDEFYNALTNIASRLRSNKNILKLLMDQSGIVSGIGNYLSAEILFDAKISPHKPIKNLLLNKDLCDKLNKSMKYIVKLVYLTGSTKYINKIKDFSDAVRNNNNDNHYNYHYDYHYDIDIGNNRFSFKVYKKKYDPYGNKINISNIIGKRKTYWSSFQK